MSTGEKVAIVVDQDYSGLAELASLMAVWVVDTPANRRVMEKLWKERKDFGNDLTLFKSTTGLSKESQVLAQIPTIELHFPDANSFLLIGVCDAPTLRDEFIKLGYLLEVSGDGVLARKPGQITH